jgi:apolipoprotein N-acyltransferase
MAWWNKIGWWRWLVSGLLLGAGFVHPWLWLLGLVGAGMFIKLSRDSGSRKRVLVYAWLAWSVKAGLAILWLWSTYPIAWLPSELGQIQLVLIGFYWLSSACSLGLGGVVAFWLIRQVKRFFSHRPLLVDVVLPFGWVVAELAGSLVYSVIMFGPGGAITPALSFGYTGYLLVAIPGVIMLAKAAGVYGLSYLFAVVATAGLHLWEKRGRLLWVAPAVALSVLLVLGVENQGVVGVGSVQQTQKIVVIDTMFPPELLRHREGTQLISAETTQAVMAALALDPDHIILPEDARFFDQSIPARIERDNFIKNFNEPNSSIIDTGRAVVDGDTVLQSFVYSGPEVSVGQVHKRYLVPQGEYVSYWLEGLLRVFGYGPMVDQVLDGMSYRIGPDTDQSGLDERAPAILFCFEGADPLGVRRIMNERPNAPFVAHPISHSWFHEPQQLWQEFDAMLRVQAVWNGKYIVSAGSNVEGKVYTSSGKIMYPETVKEDVSWRVRVVTLML